MEWTHVGRKNGASEKSAYKLNNKTDFRKNLSLMFYIINVNKPFEIFLILAYIRLKTVSLFYVRLGRDLFSNGRTVVVWKFILRTAFIYDLFLFFEICFLVSLCFSDTARELATPVGSCTSNQPLVHLCNHCFQSLVLPEYKTIATCANNLIKGSPFGYRFMVISYRSCSL